VPSADDTGNPIVASGPDASTNQEIARSLHVHSAAIAVNLLILLASNVWSGAGRESPSLEQSARAPRWYRCARDDSRVASEQVGMPSGLSHACKPLR
jgi:hypothetical protein